MNHEKVTQTLADWLGSVSRYCYLSSFGRQLSWMYMLWVVKGHPKLMLAGAL